ncbi:MAG: rod shape-determining protein MreD [Acidimicrobiia bacterium]
MIDLLRTPVVRVAILVLTVLVLQIGMVSQFPIASVTPDLMLLFAIAAGVVAGPERGSVVAFTFGMAFDLMVHTPFGLSALCFTLVAYVLAQIQTGLLRGGVLVPALTTFLASAGGVALWAVLAALFGDTYVLSYHLVTVIVVVGTVNVLLAPIARRLMHWAAASDGGVRLTGPTR